jgi:hypothetical protein
VGSRRNLAVLIACLVVAAAVAVAVAFARVSHLPRAGLRASPTPRSTLPGPPTPLAPSASALATPVPPAATRASPGPSRSTPPASRSPSAARATSPAALTSPGPGGVTLVASPLGFSYPAGWVAGPLITRNAAVQTETVTDPAGHGRIDYLRDSSPAFYNPDRTINDGTVETAIEAAFPCAVLLTTSPVPNKGFGYTCTPYQGLAVSGMVLVGPYATGVLVLQVALPSGEGPLAAAILAGFR